MRLAGQAGYHRNYFEMFISLKTTKTNKQTKKSKKKKKKKKKPQQNKNKQC